VWMPSRNFGMRFPYGLCLAVLSISLVGVINLASASRVTRPHLPLVQLLWLAIGFICLVAVSSISLRTLRIIAYPLYIFSTMLLLLVLIVGSAVKGAQRWLDLGFFNLQPSEIAKISMILAMARYCADCPAQFGYRLIDILRPMNITRPIGVFAGLIFALITKYELITQSPHKVFFNISIGVLFLVTLIWFIVAAYQLTTKGLTFEKIVAPIDVLALPVLLVLIEPDLGTSSLVLAAGASIILFAGVRKMSLLIATVLALILAVGAWQFVLEDYQKRRVETFLNPDIDVRGQGYHAAQSMIAIGSGQITGKGSLSGTQTQLSFLPENSTDFVFSVLAEEWGFLGALFLLLLYFILIFVMLRIAEKANDPFARLIAAGAVVMVFSHVAVNIGMVTGVLPVVGVTLPFMSYGGSSLIVQMIAIGFCANAAIWRRTS